MPNAVVKPSFAAVILIVLSKKGEAQMTIEPAFYNDKEVARKLNLSPSWVRGERHKRQHGLPHFLQVDPRYIGRSVRYVRSEIDAVVAQIAG